MRYFFNNNSAPLNFLVCGMLFSKDNFLHMKRQFADNVFILVKKGTLFITSNGISYDISANQFVFLKAGEIHSGTTSSKGELEYYWVHISDQFEVTNRENNEINSTYFFPETGTISNSKKLPILFNQLLDFYITDKNNKEILNYSTSLLFLELTSETKNISQKQDLPPLLFNAISWIKSNYTKNFAVQDLSDFLNCSASLITAIFKKNLNLSIIQYTNKIRIEAAKNLLGYFDYSVKECAYECGFEDEKYFMKVFKKNEGITPTQFKEAFSLKNVNK